MTEENQKRRDHFVEVERIAREALVEKRLVEPSPRNDFVTGNPTLRTLGQGDVTFDSGLEIGADAAHYQESKYFVAEQCHCRSIRYGARQGHGTDLQDRVGDGKLRTGGKGMTSEERANRIYEASKSGWRRCVTDMMSTQYMIYHWSMPVLLAAEVAVLLFLAIWPLWCGVLIFMAARSLFDSLNEWVAYLAWRRYDRLYNEKEAKQ